MADESSTSPAGVLLVHCVKLQKDLPGLNAFDHRKVAVIVGGGLGQNSGRTGWNARLSSKRQVVRIEDAGRIGFTAKECADSITLAADVITMLANERVKRQRRKTPRCLDHLSVSTAPRCHMSAHSALSFVRYLTDKD